MKVMKGVVILALLMTLTLCAFNVTAASSMPMSTSQPRSGSSTHYYFSPILPSNETDNNQYPPVVAINQGLVVEGHLYKNNSTPVKVGLHTPHAIYHGEIIGNQPTPVLWKVASDDTGTFLDNFYLATQGRHDIIYTYVYGDGLADFCVSNVVSIYVVQTYQSIT